MPTDGVVNSTASRPAALDLKEMQRTIKTQLQAVRAERRLTPQRSTIQQLDQSNFRELSLGDQAIIAYLRNREGVGGKTIGDGVSQEEYDQLKGLIEQMANRNVAAGKEKTFDQLKQKDIDAALNELVVATMNESQKSISQQSYQLTLLDRLLKLMETNPLSDQKWNDHNGYRHYIRHDADPNSNKPGAACESPAEAVRVVCERVKADIKNDGQLSPETARDIGALMTAVGKEYKHLMFEKINRHNAAVYYMDRANADIEARKAIDPNDPMIKQQENYIQELKDGNDFIPGHDGKISIGSKVKEWDAYRVGQGFRALSKGLYRYLFSATKPNAPHAKLAITKSGNEGEPAEITGPGKGRFSTSRFGPSMTVWNTSLFLETVLGATRTEQKVYAATQATDWAVCRDGKYGGMFHGAHTPIEAMTTFAEAHGSDHETAHAKETLIRLILDSRVAVTAGEPLQFNRVTAEDFREDEVLFEELEKAGQKTTVGLQLKEATARVNSLEAEEASIEKELGAVNQEVLETKASIAEKKAASGYETNWGLRGFVKKLEDERLAPAEEKLAALIEQQVKVVAELEKAQAEEASLLEAHSQLE